MMNNTDRLIEIIEDHNSLRIALRLILEALVTKKLPSVASCPCFNDELAEDDFKNCLKMITGKSIDE